MSEPPSLPIAPPRAAPVTEEGRLAPLDVLRGVAVLGILYMNIQSFSMIQAAYSNPAAMGGDGPANFLVWVTSEVLFKGKFIATFSMLYGAGIVLQHQRLMATQRPAWLIHLRRSLALLVIGMLHSYLLWSGDILFHYALAGLLLYPLQRLRAHWLVPIAVGFLVLESIFTARGPAVEPEQSDGWMMERFAFNPSERWVEQELSIYRGTWTEQMDLRIVDSAFLEIIGFMFSTFWWCGGLILLGMALQKWRFFTGMLSARIYLLFVAIALFGALPFVVSDVVRVLREGWDSPYAMAYFGEITERASVPMALGLSSAVMLWCQIRLFRGNLAPRTDRALFGLSLYDRLAATGRMAFTNYLMQTVICTTLFYGHGLGLFGYVERWGQFFIVLVIWMLQLFWSPLWLRYFRFGPAEWLWRSLTYLRPQPILRPRRVTIS